MEAFGSNALAHRAGLLLDGTHDGLEVVIARARAWRAGQQGALLQTLSAIEELVGQVRLRKGWGDAWRLFTDAA